MTDREIITLRGKTPEERTALKRRVMEELAEELAPMEALRLALIEQGMMEPGFRAVRALRTDNIDWDIRRDDPDHDHRNWAKPPIDNEDIRHDRDQLQARKAERARATRNLLDARPRAGRRAQLLAGGSVPDPRGKGR